MAQPRNVVEIQRWRGEYSFPLFSAVVEFGKITGGYCEIVGILSCFTGAFAGMC